MSQVQKIDTDLRTSKQFIQRDVMSVGGGGGFAGADDSSSGA